MISGCATTGGQAAVPATLSVAAESDDTPVTAVKPGLLIHEDGRNAILYGDGYVYTVESPKGWKLDGVTDEGDGEYAVFYPDNGSWNVSDAVMYSRADRKRPDYNSVTQAICDDTQSFEEDEPGVFIMPGAGIDTRDGLNSAEVRLFYYTGYDAVAYIEEKDSIVIVVLTARSNAKFEDSLPAFRKLVGSYYYMGDRLKITQ